MALDEPTFDVFLSHASEDKEQFVDALVKELKNQGIVVWYDKDQIKVGDDIRIQMEQGISNSRHGVVVASPHFFKYWPETELSALYSKRKRPGHAILPVILNLTQAELEDKSPFLGSLANLPASEGASKVAYALSEAIRDAKELKDTPEIEVESQVLGEMPTDIFALQECLQFERGKEGALWWLTQNREHAEQLRKCPTDQFLILWRYSDLTRRLDCTKFLVDEIRSRGVSTEQAKAWVHNLYVCLIHHHPQAPKGRCHVGLEVYDARRRGGPFSVKLNAEGDIQANYQLEELDGIGLRAFEVEDKREIFFRSFYLWRLNI